jgi:hypothetical protein
MLWSYVDGLVLSAATRVSSEVYHLQVMTQAGDIVWPDDWQWHLDRNNQ